MPASAFSSLDASSAMSDPSSASAPALAPASLSPTTSLASQLLSGCEARGLALAVAESLTGGLLSAAIVEIPGASRVYRGSVTAYATPLKAQILGVDQELLAEHGPVHPVVAAQMAGGVARVLGADLGISTTGVAGPGPADGHPAGTVFVAASLGEQILVRPLHVEGDRAAVRAASVAQALECALELFSNEPS